MYIVYTLIISFFLIICKRNWNLEKITVMKSNLHSNIMNSNIFLQGGEGTKVRNRFFCIDCFKNKIYKHTIYVEDDHRCKTFMQHKT